MTTTTKLAQSTMEAYQGFAAGDLNPLFLILHEGITWIFHGKEGPPYTKRFSGIEGVQEFFSYMPDMEFHRFEVQDIIEQGNKVVAIIDSSQTYTPTGDTHDGQEVHVLLFEEDKILQMDVYPPAV